MGLLAAIRQLAFSFLVAFNRVYAFFSRRPKLHGSRFARIDELKILATHALDREGSLISWCEPLEPRSTRQTHTNPPGAW